MNPLLFLGREFLNKMTGPDVPAEEREAYRDSLAVYSGSEEGAATPVQLIRSFNDLKADEYEGFTPDAMLWFVDWIASQENAEVAGVLSPAVFQSIFTAFEEPQVRLRVVEVAVQWEEARGVQPNHPFCEVSLKLPVRTAIWFWMPCDSTAAHTPGA